MANALWVTRMCTYRQSVHAVKSAETIINVKVARRRVLLKRYGIVRPASPMGDAVTVQHVLLHEARAAKKFWLEFKRLLPDWTQFPGRFPREKDLTNNLLDIGYHHLANRVKRLLTAHNVSFAMGLIHIPRTADSAPLVYDLMELFRADVVDAEVLRFLRLKKKPVRMLTQKHIAHFLHEVNERMDKKYYLRDFKQCHTYHYYMNVQVLKFIKAVNHKEVFHPIILPTRHDSRCS